MIPALIKKFVEAKENNYPSVEIWGTGVASREFLYVSDAARGICLAAEKFNDSFPVNLGSGMEISIKELVEEIQKITGYSGKIIWDSTKPDGQPRRYLDISRAEKEFEFKADVPFSEGLKETIQWFENHRQIK